MFIQLFSCLFLCCGFIFLQSAQAKPKKQICSLDDFKKAVQNSVDTSKQKEVTFSPSPSSSINDRSDYTKDKKNK